MSRENIDVVINDLEENIAWLKKEAELHELAMQQNKDRMQDLEDENATLRQQNAELVEALAKYGKHKNDEHAFCAKLKHSKNTCTCGFETVLNNQPQPCGHPRSAIVSSGEGTCYYGECAKEMKE